MDHGLQGQTRTSGESCHGCRTAHTSPTLLAQCGLHLLYSEATATTNVLDLLDVLSGTQPTWYVHCVSSGVTGSSFLSNSNTTGLLRLPKSNTPTCRHETHTRVRQQSQALQVAHMHDRDFAAPRLHAHCIVGLPCCLRFICRTGASDCSCVIQHAYSGDCPTCCLYVSAYSPSASRCAALLLLW